MGMTERYHCASNRLHHSTSAAVIVGPGLAHAMTGRADSSRARIETPALPASLTPISLVLTIVRSNRLRKVSITPVSGPFQQQETRDWDPLGSDVLASQSPSTR